MHELIELINKDMVPALGVTEPGAVAFCVATAKKYSASKLKHISVILNSGMYKNGFSCGIPHCDEVGSVYAAALGYVSGDPSKGLECLDSVSQDELAEAKKLVESSMVSVTLGEITSKIYIEVRLLTETDSVTVIAQDAHTNITEISVNGNAVYKNHPASSDTLSEEVHLIHRYSVSEMVDLALTCPLEDILFIKEAYRVNLALMNEGLSNPRTTFARALLDLNGGEIISCSEEDTAVLMCGAAIEARVIGLDLPAMSITGSGAHGIIATLPLYALAKVSGVSEEMMLRATLLSYLICTYIKEYSGKLSAFCGCGIAAGTGMCAGLCLMKGGNAEDIGHAINNMSASLTGMICDGGNHGCTMKGISATATAFKSASLALKGVYIGTHGINAPTPEETMRNMGLIASPGMTATEKTILEIQSRMNK